MKNSIAVLAVLLAVTLTAVGDVFADDEPSAIDGSYFAVIVNDMKTSCDWYANTFGLVEQTRMYQEGRFEIVNLVKPGLFVELLELTDAVPRPDGRIQGPFKVGYLVDDIEAFVDSLPVEIGASARIIHDEPNKLMMLQLKDPDERIIQVMQRLPN